VRTGSTRWMRFWATVINLHWWLWLNSIRP